MSAAPELEAERLLLRGWRDEDTGPWAELCADDEVMRSLGRAGSLAPGDAWRDVAVMAGHWALKGYGRWVLELRGAGHLISLIAGDNVRSQRWPRSSEWSRRAVRTCAGSTCACTASTCASAAGASRAPPRSRSA